VQVQVRFFAIHRERLGVDRVSVELPAGARLADLIAAVGDRFPTLQPLIGSARFAVNREYALPLTELHDGDEVAFVPPVAGGGEQWPSRL
jgi:molybdopterin converting factor subunit 1